MLIGTQGFVLHSAKLGLHDKGGGGGAFDIVSPTLQKVGEMSPCHTPPIDAHEASVHALNLHNMQHEYSRIMIAANTQRLNISHVIHHDMHLACKKWRVRIPSTKFI